MTMVAIDPEETGGPEAGSTYRAVHVVRPGKLELTEKPLLDPNPGHVRVRVEACGVCHSDSFTVDGAFPIEWPRVPGHEAVPLNHRCPRGAAVGRGK